MNIIKALFPIRMVIKNNGNCSVSFIKAISQVYTANQHTLSAFLLREQIVNNSAFFFQNTSDTLKAAGSGTSKTQT